MLMVRDQVLSKSNTVVFGSEGARIIKTKGHANETFSVRWVLDNI